MNTFSRNVRANENVFPRTFRRGDFPGEFAPWGPMHILCTRAVMHFSCDYMDSTQKSDWRFFFSPRVSNLLSFLMPCELLPITVSSLLLVSHYFILTFSSFPFLPCLSFFFPSWRLFPVPLAHLFIMSSEKDMAKQARSLSSAAGKLLQKDQ